MLRFPFTQADVRDLGVGKESGRDLTPGGDAVAAGKIVVEDAKIVQVSPLL